MSVGHRTDFYLSRESLSRPAVASRAPQAHRAVDFVRLRNEFRQLLTKTETLARLAAADRPGFRMLSELAKVSIVKARIADQRLAHAAESNDAVWPIVGQVEQLIEEVSELQDRLQRQLALVAQLQLDADELQSELQLLVSKRLVGHQPVPFHGVKLLARRLISELLYDVTPPVLHPRLALEVLTDRLGNFGHARIFAIALATAHSVARVARVTWLGEEQVEQVTAAALLQDCGKLLVQQSPRPSRPSRHSGSSSNPRHSQIGAAVVRSYRDAPSELASLIAGHHQRMSQMDVARNSARESPAALLAAASRFERLRIRHADNSTLFSPTELVDQPAMIQLWRETLDGDWNPRLVRKVLAQRDGCHESIRIAERAKKSSRRVRGSLTAETTT